MKKFLKGLLITLVVLIILPIALIFIFLFDTSRMQTKLDENFVTENWSKNLVVDSLDVTATEKKIRFGVSEEDINNIIYAAIKDNKELQKYLTQLAIDIQKDSYTLNVSGKLFFFETRAKLTAKISKEIVTSEAGEKEAFVLSINKMSLGRLTQLKQVIMFFLQRFVNNQTLDALTASLKIHSDLKNSKMFIYTDDLRDMINNGVNGGEGTQEFYFSFINDFLDLNLVNIDFYGGDAMTIDINIEPLTGNDYDASVGENVYYPMRYEDTTTKLTFNGEERKLSLDTIRDAIVYLLDRNEIQLNEISAISDYLYQGYKITNVPDADLSSIGIPAKEAYPGFALVAQSSIDDTFKNAITTFDGYNPSINSFDIARLTEGEINLFLKSQSALGNKYLLQREISDGKHKISYIAVDNAYMNIFGDNAAISVGLNLNGLETLITMKMKLDQENTSSDKLVYIPEKVYFGKEAENLAISDDTKRVIFETLSDAMYESTFRFDRDGKMTISFNSIINSAINAIPTTDPLMAQYKSFLQNDATFSIAVEGDNVTDNSVVKIQATRA